MSPRFPTKLLCLTTISCLTVLGVVHRPQLSPVPGRRTSAENSPANSRYPANQVVPQSRVVMAAYTFDAPPLPEPLGSSTRRKERVSARTEKKVSAQAVSLRRRDGGREPQIVRLPKTESVAERSQQPVTVTRPSATPINLRQSVRPAAGEHHWERLPPVDKIDESPSPASAENATPIVPKNPLRTLRETATKSLRAPQRRHIFPRVAALPLTRKPLESTLVGVSINDVAVQTNLNPIPQVHAPPARPRAEQEARSVLTSRLPGPDPALVAVNRQAMDLVRNGQSLAVRNAEYSARDDFIQALQMIAQAHDATEGGSRYTKHLAAGFLALREAEDFVANGAGRWTDQFDVQVISSGHGTPIIRDLQDSSGKAPDMTTWVARQKYYTFAQQQLSQAGANEPVAAAALFSLGKLYVARNGNSGKGNLVSSAEAMVYFQAALQVDPRNYTAANELGVLLARFGQLQDARTVLRHAVAVKQDFPPIWSNLAIVHQRLGEVDLERRARHELELAKQQVASGQSPADLGGSIHWLEPEAFANSTGRPPGPRTADRAAEQESTPESQTPPWQFWK